MQPKQHLCGRARISKVASEKRSHLNHKRHVVSLPRAEFGVDSSVAKSLNSSLGQLSR